SPVFALDIYVSTKGNDNNRGTINSPFATIERARNQIRSLKASGNLPKDGVNVWLRGGVYELRETFSLYEYDSGTADCPILYSGYNGENVYISGGQKLDTRQFHKIHDKGLLSKLSEDVRDKVYELDLKQCGITDVGIIKQFGFGTGIITSPLELFFNGQAMQIARYPNEGWLGYEKVIDAGSRPSEGDPGSRPGKFVYADDRISRWSGIDDVWLFGFFKFGWAEDFIGISSIDPIEKTINLKHPHAWGLTKGWERFYAMNIFDEIDKPGEWYLNRKTNKLYFYPPSELDGAQIQVSIMEKPLMSLYETSFITLENMTFECVRGVGIYREGGSHNLISNCTIRNTGSTGVQIGKGVDGIDFKHQYPDLKGVDVAGSIGHMWARFYEDTVWDRNAGTLNGVAGCHIYNNGSGGIFMGGGDRKKLTPGFNYAVNNQIHNFNRRNLTYCPGIETDGCGNKILHNEIYNAPQGAIFISGNEHRIEYNYIHDVTNVAEDFSAFYMGRNPSDRGNSLRYNFWKNIGSEWGHYTHAIYNDDGTCDTEAFGNVFYNAGKGGTFFISGGSDFKCTNNIFINCQLAVLADNRFEGGMKGSSDKLWEDRLNLINHKYPPYSERYPEFVSFWEDNFEKPKRNMIINNILLNCGRFHTMQEDWGTVEGNFIADEDPGFVDSKGFDFTLKEDSEAYKKIPDFKPIPFRKIGRYQDENNLLPPFIWPLGGILSEDKEITLTSPDVKAVIRYTTDGTEPDMKSNVYSSPIKSADLGSAVITAKAFKDKKGSHTVSQEAFICDRSSPTKVTDFKTERVRHCKVVFSWKPSSDDVGIGFYRITKIIDDKKILVCDVNPDDSMASDMSPMPAKVCDYKIVAFDKSGKFSEPESINVKVPGPQPPSTDIEFNVIDYTNSVRLKWGDLEPDVNKITIYRKTGREKRETIFTFSDMNIDSFADRNVTAGSFYTYSIELQNSSGKKSVIKSNKVVSLKKLNEGGGLNSDAIIEQSGVVVDHNGNIGFCDNGDWIYYGEHDFDGNNRIEMLVGVAPEAAGKRMVFRINSVGGPIIATHKTVATKGWGDFEWQSVSCKPVKGVHKLYLTFEGGTGV
ncbi:MAG: carbohydrate-binding protein, partial [Nitrospinales bacterium]